MIKNNIFIIHATLGFGGGVGSVIKNLIRYQIESGYSIGILYFEDLDIDNKFIEEVKDKVYLFPQKRKDIKGFSLVFGLPMKKLYKKLKKIHSEYKFVIHAHNPAAVGLIHSIRKVPLVCTIHGVNTVNSALSQKITEMILKKLERNNIKLVAVSEQTADFYNRQLSSQRIEIVKNGVKVNKTEKLSINCFRIGFASNINDHKGWRFLLDAFIKIYPSIKGKAKLLFAGDGSKQEIEELENRINVNNLKDSIQYVGFIPSAGETFISQLDLLVLPSASEGMPMVILEALGHGVPVLATDVGGIPGMIKDGVNGYLISRNSDSIAEKMEKIINEPELYKSLCSNAAAIYRENFTVEIMGKKYDELYNQSAR